MSSIGTRNIHLNRKWLILNISDLETNIIGQFLGPETDRISQFKGQETNIMGERYYIHLCHLCHMINDI